jgi:deazaflavin-dependent oxidoreductase (nitroreductase family)
MAITLSGRLNNLFSTRLDGVARAFGRFHQRRHAAGKGKLFDRVFPAPVFSLTVRGRRSGEPRSVMLILVRRGDDVVVAGSNGGNPKPPSWYLNLRDAGEAEVDVRGERWRVTARQAEGEEREELWRLLCATYRDFETYQALTERRIPVVVLERAATT